MKNVLSYYYNLDVNHIKYSNGLYRFNIKNNSYLLAETNRNDEELNEIYNVCNELYNMKIPVHEIILNKFNNKTTIYNNKKYILLKKKITDNELITFFDVIKFSYHTKKKWDYKNITSLKWDKLWQQKIDYFEYQISQVYQNFPLASRVFCYYGGLIENNIQLLNTHNNDIKQYSICHKRIDVEMKTDDFYNPLNFIIDYSVRDVAEYLKSRMSINLDIYEEVSFYLKFYLYNSYEIYLFFVRIFFPSKQIDSLEKIFSKKEDEKIIYNIINSNELYEKNIKKIYALFRTYIANLQIEWLV